MLEKLKGLSQKYAEIEYMLSQSEVWADAQKAAALSREKAELAPLMEAYARYETFRQEAESAEELLSDPEMKDLARETLSEARSGMERTAEELKINIGSVIPRSEQLYMEVTGRNLITGLPKTMRITSDDVTEALDDPLQQLIKGIHGVLEHTPAELAADIFEYGILLSGGGAELFGLCEAIADTLKVPCSCAEDPQNNVVIGCGRALENMADLGKFLDDGRRRMLGRA